ncbi:Magnesium transporter MRS2-11 [Durusdinium trenchii]|uniref:Chloroplastic (Magnesium Transporter 10) (AtMGT10) n=1 Tax=Durusdinium trenchii TaxID=1381693 RepID=A0ABP0JV07_9DINO
MIPAPSAWQLRHSPPAKPCRGQARYGRAFCGVSATAATTWRLSRLSGQLLLRPTRDSARLASEKPELLSDLAGLADFGCDDTGCTVDVDASSNGSTSMKEDPSAEFISTEAAEVSRFLARPGDFTYAVTEVTAEGRVSSMTITRSKLLTETGLRPRDLRAVSVPLKDSDAGPMLSSRRSGLLIGLGDVRAVVEEARALLFGPRSRDQIRFLRVLENQKRALAEGAGMSQASSFRMVFVESALLALSRNLASRLFEIRKRTEPKLRAPPVLREPDLEEVRQLRRTLVRCASQASAVSSALLSRLDGDEAKLLAAGDTDPASHDEWEALLESYLQAYSELSRQCTSLLQDIEDFEGSASLALQARRLRVEQFELSLVIASVSIAAGGIVPGAMGMNLVSGYESSDVAFRIALLITVCVVICLFLTIRFLAARQGFLL